MTDPREATQRHDPRTTDSGVSGPSDDERTAADDMETAEEDAAQDAESQGDDPNDLEADNAVEADSLETLDPDNPPA